MEKEKSIYELELHETGYARFKNHEALYSATRVPGGWLYRDIHTRVAIFVPYNNDFDFLNN